MTPDRSKAFLVASNGHPDPADLTLHAMRLVNGDQAAAIADHLAHCAECTAELGRIHGDLVLAVLTTGLETPAASARERLLGQVAREKKLAPAAPKMPEQSESVQPQARPIPSFGHSGSVLSIDEHKPNLKRGTRLIVLTGLGWAAAAALCLTSGLLLRDRQNLRRDLAAQQSQIGRLDADAAQAHQLMDALTDPGAMRVSMRMPATPKPQGVPSGGVTYNPQKGTLIFLASNMGALEQYKAYELWIIPADNSAPIPAGTFHPDRQGNASVVMPDLPKGIPAKAFGVTIEPDGGTQTPTMPLVMFGN
ncbi:MAG TPA: anti-sigma factor [Acidobacteriaceae bacterium]